MTEPLERALAEARTALEANPDGHLPLPVRRRVWAAWGLGEGGRRHTYALARLVAEHVLPYWEARRPADRRPHDALALADALAAGEIERETALVEAGGIDNDLVEMFGTEIDEPTFDAGIAAQRTVFEATGADAPESPADPGDDEDYDADEWRAEFFASMVAAPSLPKMKVAEHVEPRRAFWRWYLDEAVPAADREPHG